MEHARQLDLLADTLEHAEDDVGADALGRDSTWLDEPAAREVAVAATVRDRAHAPVAAGKTLEQVQAAKPSAEFDAKWGAGFIKGENYVEMVFRSLTRLNP